MVDPKLYMRKAIEALMDDIKKDPQLFEQTVKSMFNKLGIESSLDAVICYIMGICQGTISAMVEYAVVEFNESRERADDLIVEMMDFAFPRIIVLKEFMLSQRIHE